MPSPNYKAYVDRLTDLRGRETAQQKRIVALKTNRSLFGRKQRQKDLEQAEIMLDTIRSEAERLCAMLEDLREKAEDKVMRLFWDEEPMLYNEVIGLCYGRVILCTDVGELLYTDYDPTEGAAIGDTLPDLADFAPLDALTRGERILILSYLIEAGETPLHDLALLRDRLKQEMPAE